MINPKKKKRSYLDYDLEGYIKGQQTARTDATSNLQATTLRLVAENNTSEKVLLRRVANERRKTLEAYEKGKRDYERQQQAAKVLEDIESRPWWNPTTVLRNAKDIPIFGVAPTATEWAYGLMNKAVGNDAVGDYYMLDADKSATGQAIALAAIPAHTNPYTAAIYDTALLAPWAKELDAQGKFYHPETLTGEEAAMLGLSVLPFGLKYKPLLSYAKTAAEDAALQSSIPWVRDNARGLYLSRAINQAADLGVLAPIKVDRSIERDGTIRMSLPSHTSEQPRLFVIDPLGNNKYYIHMRTWDGKKVPANLSAAEKNALFESVYNELPEGAEILFPKSSEDYLATRGTVAGLQRLSRDKRFSPGQEGTLLYYDDKTGQTKTYTGTSFIKNPQLSTTLYVIENSEPVNVPTISWGDAAKDNIGFASLDTEINSKLPAAVKAVKAMKKADADVAKMNEYHTKNVEAYNEATGSNIIAKPFRTDYSTREIKVLPKEEFNETVGKIKTNSPSTDIENIGGLYRKRTDTVFLRNNGTPSNAYHEFLHSNYYGVTNPEVTKWRIRQLVDSQTEAKMSPTSKAYFLSESEFPVHLRQQGELMGINVGDPFPGEEAFDNLLHKYPTRGASYYTKGVQEGASLEDKKLLWKALNGTLFGGIGAIAGAAYGASQQDNNLLIQVQKSGGKLLPPWR